MNLPSLHHISFAKITLQTTDEGIFFRAVKYSRLTPIPEPHRFFVPQQTLN